MDNNIKATLVQGLRMVLFVLGFMALTSVLSSCGSIRKGCSPHKTPHYIPGW